MKTGLHCGSNRPRNRCQGEGIGQNGFAGFEVKCAQRAAKRIAARGHGEAVSRTGQGGEFFLQQGGFGHFACGGVIAVQAAVAQNDEGGGDAFFGNGFLLGEVALENLCHFAASSRSCPISHKNTAKVTSIPVPVT